MTPSERKMIFSVIGVMLVIMLIVLGIKLFSKPDEETSGGITNNTQISNSVQNNEKYSQELSDGTKVNTSSQLKNEKTYKTIKISNIQFTHKNGQSTLLADLTNTGNSTFKREEVNIAIIGEDGKEITTIPGVIPTIEAGKTKLLDSSVTADITNAKDFVIEAK